jgi:hypothetical protein
MDWTMILGVFTFVGIFLGMLLFLEAGRRIRLRMIAHDAEKAGAGLGAVDGALFALMGLIIAFTFSGAAARFDARRQIIVQEANDIGTAYLRLDLLPESAQPQLREKFRQYVDTRLETYRVLPDVDAAMAQLAKGNELQQEIWKVAVAAAKEAQSPQATMVLLPALNAMLDIANTRYWSTQLHPPLIIFALLGILALICSLLAGFGMAGGKARSWIHIAAFAAILTLTVYVIIDMEYPRMGFIRVDAFDRALVEVRASMQ